DELSGDLGQLLGASLRPAKMGRDGTTLDPAAFAQLLHKRGHPLAIGRRCGLAQVPDGRQLPRLLPARNERPRGCHAAEQRYDLAPLHSITSSARSRIDVGSSMPITLAVLRLTISSNFVACSTGRSAGFAPFKIFAT